MNMKKVSRYTTAISLALALSTAYAAGDSATSSSPPAEPLTGKQKATAIGATTGAVVGAGIGGYVGHAGTDANGKVATSATSRPTDTTVRKAQEALNSQGYSVGAVDGRWGPNTENAVRRFQAKSGLTESGTLDSPTLSALGVNG